MSLVASITEGSVVVIFLESHSDAAAKVADALEGQGCTVERAVWQEGAQGMHNDNHSLLSARIALLTVLRPIPRCSPSTRPHLSCAPPECAAGPPVPSYQTLTSLTLPRTFPLRCLRTRRALGAP